MTWSAQRIERELLEAAERILTDGRRHEDQAIGWALTQRENARRHLSPAERACAVLTPAERSALRLPQRPKRNPHGL